MARKKRLISFWTTASTDPTASQLELGEVAVNAIATNPRLYIKDANSNIVTFLGQSAIAGNYLNLTGGTLTGLLTANSGISTTNATASGHLSVGSTSYFAQPIYLGNDIVCGGSGLIGYDKIEYPDASRMTEYPIHIYTNDYINISGTTGVYIMSHLTVSSTAEAQGFYQTSDERLKVGIKDISTDYTKVVNPIDQLNPVIFRWRKDASKGSGFVAQEVKKIPALSHIVGESSNGYLNIDYSQIIPYMVSKIQSMEKEIEELKQELKKK